jgi:hypothetical protein
MNEKSESKESAYRMPRNKANMDQPQEEFIDPQSAHLEPGKQNQEARKQPRPQTEE